MTEKKPFTKDGIIYVGFFDTELANNKLPLEFTIIGKDGKVDIITKEVKDKYPSKPVLFGSKETLRHEIPVTEFVVQEVNTMPVDLEDAFMSHFTLRDLFSIYNNMPVSNKQWLNELIIKYKH